MCLFQGDRFGGALDGAARQFSEAYDKGMLPNEFVNDMRKRHKLIMGIGHRVKSVCILIIFYFVVLKVLKIPTGFQVPFVE